MRGWWPRLRAAIQSAFTSIEAASEQSPRPKRWRVHLNLSASREQPCLQYQEYGVASTHSKHLVPPSLIVCSAACLVRHAAAEKGMWRNNGAVAGALAHMLWQRECAPPATSNARVSAESV